MSQNEFLSEKIKNLDADYQMLISSGNYEPSCNKCLISEGSVLSKINWLLLILLLHGL